MGVHDALQWTAGRLLVGSLEGSALVGIIWLLCRRVESIPAAARAMLWWLATLKLLVALVPVPAVPLPVLPPTHAVATDARPLALELVEAIARSGGDVVIEALPPVPTGGGVPWVTVAIAGWLLVVGLQTARLIAAHCMLRRIVARSAPAGADEVALTAHLASGLGLTALPAVRVSAEIDAPQVVRFWRPLILLPAAVETFTDEERTMTICHELVHVRRRDLALGWIPALAERLFFFHPLARLAAREYLVAREAACDAAVLGALDVEPVAYGRLLVRLGVVGSEPGLSAAGSSISQSSLRRRLVMLERVSSTGLRTRAVWCAVAAVIATSLPLKLVARTAPVTQPAAAVRPVDQNTTNGAAPKPVAATTIAKQPEVLRAAPRQQRVVRVAREEQSIGNQRLAELDAEREKRLSQLQGELAKRLAAQETARLESLLDAMKRAAEPSTGTQDTTAAIREAIEAHARRLAEQAKQRPENAALGERLRGEMEILRAQVTRLEEQRETLLGQQRALVAAQQRLSAEVDKLAVLIRQLEAERRK